MRTWAEVCAAWLQAGAEYRRATSEALHGLECFYCGDQAQSVDHIIARASGGPDHPDNLVPVCRSCNGQKSAKSLEEWASQIRAELARVPRRRRQLAAVQQLMAAPSWASADAELDAALDRAMDRVA